jgi:two-component system, chemotaxis family, sensor kinase CheA
MVHQELEDAAFTVVQLEPAEHADIKALRDKLRQFAVFDEQALPAVRALAQDAATQLNLIVLGGCDDPEAALTRASEAIERAMQVADRGSDAGLPPVAVAPAPVVIEAAPSATPSAPAAPAPTHSAAAITIPADADLALMRDFIAESRDGITGAEAALLALEADPADIEAINTVFRAFHTVKGTAAFMGLDPIAEFAHHAESLLSRVREKELPYTQGVASLSLRSSDLLGELMDAVDRAMAGAGHAPVPAGYAPLMADLLNVDAVLAGAPTAVATRTSSDTASDEAASVRKPKADGEQSVRVRTDRLDRLIDMVGELVIAQSMLAGDAAAQAATNHEFTKKIAHTGKIVRELQDLAMGMRMMPLKGTFQKLARLVRDVAVKAGKQVEFVTDGEETELDRSMVDVIGDPLVHMVRNAVDHGIEPPTGRAASGKASHGTVRLSAFNQGGSVVVELRDDGRGLDRDKILAKAIEKGVVSPTQSLTDSEIYGLIFAPGFSTAEKVTDISGRGVGMDVVRRNIESIRGRIDIQTVLGEGTTFQIRLPLTLAVTDGMIVRCGSERYIVPITSIALSFRPEREMLSTIAGRGEVVMLRGDVYPIVRLHEVFGVADAVTDATEGILMLVGDGDQRVALLVDALLSQQQVVAKALGDGVGQVAGLSGGAILGDGRVGLIVDIAELTAVARTHAVAVAA